jgi:thiamine kinase-like enzyme
LIAANILDDGRNLALVDFEYAVRGPPILDLASLVAMNDFDSLQRDALLAAYGRGAASYSPHELASVVRMVRLFALFWALLGARHASDAESYRALADRMSAAADE